MILCKRRKISSTNGSCSPDCCITKCRRHFCAILMKVSQAMSCTPSWVSCMNSKSLLTTVFKNFQCALRNRGYWPTMYIMSEATTALLSFPRLISQSPNRSLITVTKKRFSVSSSIHQRKESAKS